MIKTRDGWLKFYEFNYISDYLENYDIIASKMILTSNHYYKLKNIEVKGIVVNRGYPNDYYLILKSRDKREFIGVAKNNEVFDYVIQEGDKINLIGHFHDLKKAIDISEKPLVIKSLEKVV